MFKGCEKSVSSGNEANLARFIAGLDAPRLLYLTNIPSVSTRASCTSLNVYTRSSRQRSLFSLCLNERCTHARRNDSALCIKAAYLLSIIEIERLSIRLGVSSFVVLDSLISIFYESNHCEARPLCSRAASRQTRTRGIINLSRRHCS